MACYRFCIQFRFDNAISVASHVPTPKASRAKPNKITDSTCVVHGMKSTTDDTSYAIMPCLPRCHRVAPSQSSETELTAQVVPGRHLYIAE
jgi:hypothetical protein